MILFLLLLVAAYVVIGVYGYQNPWTHDITLFNWHWSGVAAWWPVVLASLALGVLFLLYMIYAGAVHGVRYGSVRRRVATHESAISDLKTENTRLREENVRLRGQLRGTTSAPVGPTTPVDGSGTAVYSDRAVNDPRPARTMAPNDRAPMESRASQPHQARPTFGDRVRTFFGGRQSSGY